MIKLKYHLVAFLMLCFGMGFSQSLFLPHEIGLKRKGKSTIEDIAFFDYTYKGESIDLRHFKSINPQLIAPDFITIKVPYSIASKDITVLIGLINGVKANEDAVVIWLAENYTTEKITFFVDKNLDRTFDESTEVIYLTSNSKPYEVILQPENINIPTQQMWLKVPRRKKTRNFGVNEKYKVIDRFSAEVELGVGVGKLRYWYNNLDLGFPTWYSVNFTKKNIGTSLSYNTKLLRLSLNANYQNAYSYTSYLNVRFDNPEVVINPNGTTRVKENVLVETNFDRHETHRFQYGASLGLRVHVSRVLEIQPFLGIGQTRYSSGIYDGDRYNDDKKFKLSSSNFIKAGLRFEIVAKGNNAIYLDFSFQDNQWEPEGLLDDIEYDNLDVKNQDWGMSFGYKIGL